MSESIVGRGAELATIDRFVAAATHQPRALLITGEPGIGKTTDVVIDEVLAVLAAARGAPSQ